MKKIKFISTFILAFFLPFSVGAQQLVGAINMLSNRMINFNKHYELLQKNITLDDYVIQNNAAATLQEAIDKTVLSVPCGEFIMNAQIYMFDNMFVVVGDVWGEKHNSCLYEIGDLVSWDEKRVGTIISIKNDDECVVKDLQTEQQKNLDFSDIHKVNSLENFNFFKVGDRVSFGKNKYGEVVSIKDEDNCMVKDLQNGHIKEMEFDDLTRADLDGDTPNFNVGDKVTWKVFGGISYKSGVIISIKDKNSCLVKDQSGNTKEMYFQNLFKLGE
ncbi:MAG: hypothetical protein MJZ49_07195 [Bacteroidales bacterium]|nr:hypothetical protein [Bacteroidales bacterium]